MQKCTIQLSTLIHALIFVARAFYLQESVHGFVEGQRSIRILDAHNSINSVIQRCKGHEKCIFETPHNEIEYVLSIKESNFNAKNRSKLSHLLMVWAEGADLFSPYGQLDCKKTAF